MEAIKFLRSMDQQAMIGKIALIVAGVIILVVSGMAFYFYNEALATTKEMIYIMDRKGNIVVAKNTIGADDQRLEYTAFIEHAISSFYTVEPDEEQIKNGLESSLYYGNFKAFQNKMKQDDFYNTVIKQGIFQSVRRDSVVFNPDFTMCRYYGKIVNRVTTAQGIKIYRKAVRIESKIEQLSQRTGNNPYGLYLNEIKMDVQPISNDATSFKETVETLMPQEKVF